ncbi:hypothetical protein [Xanthocytophaga flava]|uniref:hypothetical protein n=1 Tax=Xanthocytophaga flava TaxID=3048013 RepID=UPI0028D3AD95|nr:hypothetical protein [Xanthocytophaga flavus]MDJ1472577.1 hypothetical protein [Xanthocytophaga flavus]
MELYQPSVGAIGRSPLQARHRIHPKRLSDTPDHSRSEPCRGDRQSPLQGSEYHKRLCWETGQGQALIVSDILSGNEGFKKKDAGSNVRSDLK